MGRNLGAVPFCVGEVGPHLHNAARAAAYLHAKFHLDPSNRLATIHQLHRQDRQTDNGLIASFYKRSPKNVHEHEHVHVH